MFVSLNNDEKETKRFIESVTYFLHPTFKPSRIEVNEAPFLLSRLGWGYFDVKMHIQFAQWTGLGKRELIHELCFDNDGHTQSMFGEIDDDKKEGEKEADLIKIFKELKEVKSKVVQAKK